MILIISPLVARASGLPTGRFSAILPGAVPEESEAHAGGTSAFTPWRRNPSTARAHRPGGQHLGHPGQGWDDCQGDTARPEDHLRLSLWEAEALRSGNARKTALVLPVRHR